MSAFIVKKIVNGKEYFYLRSSKRVGGKVKAVNVAYLGKDRVEAEKKAAEIQESLNISSEKKDEKMVEKKESSKIDIEGMMSFCKRKGFVYASAEIYGGFAGFWDFAHLGAEMKNNLKRAWWQFHVHGRDDIVGIDGAIITNPEVWKASGHVESFSDIFVVCKKCKKPNKIDKNELGKVKCESCGGDYDEETAKDFQLMFKTTVGEDGYGYLRPETAQLIFTNFKSVQEAARLKLPFGIAQIGKAFRNEIAPRDFLFRSREFEQMEIEYFVDPDEECQYEIGDTEILIYSEDMQKSEKENEKMKIKEALEKGIIKKKWHAYWIEQEYLWFLNLGANPNKFRIRQHTQEEKAHYASDTWDLEYEFPFGWKELQGIADRADFDLRQHQEHSKKNLEIESDGKKLIPSVVCEPSQGVERAFLVFMFDSYYQDPERDNVILKLHPKLAPVKAAVFPIIKSEEYEAIAQSIVNDLQKEFNILYDKSGSIGRRYARNDEIGTPMCITVDDQTPKDKSVTIRDRDTTRQVRVKISDLRDVVRKVVGGEDLMALGKEVKTRVK